MMKGLSRGSGNTKQSICMGCGLRRVVRWFEGKLLCHPCEQEIRDRETEVRDLHGEGPR